MTSQLSGSAPPTGRIRFQVQDKGRPVRSPSIGLYIDTSGTGSLAAALAAPDYVKTALGDDQGRGLFTDLAPGDYQLVCLHQPQPAPTAVTVDADSEIEVAIEFGLAMSVSVTVRGDNCQKLDCGIAHPGDVAELSVDYNDSQKLHLPVEMPAGARVDRTDPRLARWIVPGPGAHPLDVTVLSPYVPSPGAPQVGPAAQVTDTSYVDAVQTPPQPVSGTLDVSLGRAATTSTSDLAFWQGILNSTEQLGFNNYQRYMNTLFSGEPEGGDVPPFERKRLVEKGKLFRDAVRTGGVLSLSSSHSYLALKAATEAFVMVNCGVLAAPQPFDEPRDRAYLQRRELPVPRRPLGEVFDQDYLVSLVGGAPGDRTLPYLAVIRSKLPDLPLNLGPLQSDPGAVSRLQGVLQEKFTNPCMLELIWTYWIEEGALVQTMNAISRRFQNIGSGPRDPLANLEIDPLRPLSSVLWGFVQEEQHRLSMARRCFEYCHEYGLNLQGKAVPRMTAAADCQSRFLEAFHNLVRLCATFYRQDDDTTVKADAFPVLNALKEVHLILSQSNGNQIGDMVSTTRVEMLMQQWILGRPEFREFLPTRVMTALPESWMDRVDAMKKLKGWSDTSVLHFRNLAVFSEQVLLSIRWGNWSDIQEPQQAFNWARFFRPQIQGYMHAYRAATGVDLSAGERAGPADATMPSLLMQRRMEMRRAAA
jgi:hypothetical protein